MMKSKENDVLKVQSLGCDALGNVYWYIYGTRLYKEESRPHEKKPNWEEEWSKQKEKSFRTKRGRGRPRKHRKIISDGESEESEESVNVKAEEEKSRWSVVCTTLDEWVKFAESFKDSKVKCEISLYKFIIDFVPKLYQAHELKESGLDTKNVTESETNKPEAVINNQTTEEKLEILGERALRLEQRNKRISQNMNSSTQKRKRRNKDEMASQVVKKHRSSSSSKKCRHPSASASHYEVFAEVQQVLTDIKQESDAQPFVHPLDEVCNPEYFKLIKEPMDLTTIEMKLFAGVYRTINQVDKDFRLIISNCQTYNGAKSEITQMAQNLWKTFRKRISDRVKLQEAVEGKSIAATNRTNSVLVRNHYKQRSLRVSRKSFKRTFRKKKKQKTSRNMKALELLAQASEMALKNVYEEEIICYVENSEETKSDSQTFSNLKIFPLQSHSSSSESPKSSGMSSPHRRDSPPPFTSEDSKSEGEHHFPQKATREDPDKASDRAKSLKMPSFLHEVPPKPFNILSENDNGSGLSDLEESGRLLPLISKELDQPPLEGNSEMPNILEECHNDNMSHIISKIIKEPFCAPQMKEVDSMRSDSDSSPSDSSSTKSESATKSPDLLTSESVVNQDIPLMQEGMDMRPSPTPPSGDEITTVDASILGISSVYFKKQIINSHFSKEMPVETYDTGPPPENQLNAESHERARCSPNPVQHPMPADEYFSPLPYNSPTNVSSADNVAVPEAPLPTYEEAFPRQNYLPSTAAVGPQIPLQIPISPTQLFPSQNLFKAPSPQTQFSNMTAPNQVFFASPGQNTFSIPTTFAKVTTSSSMVPQSLLITTTNANGHVVPEENLQRFIATKFTAFNQENKEIQNPDNKRETIVYPPKKRSPLLQEYVVKPVPTTISHAPNTMPVQNENTNLLNLSENMRPLNVVPVTYGMAETFFVPSYTQTSSSATRNGNALEGNQDNGNSSYQTLCPQTLPMILPSYRNSSLNTTITINSSNQIVNKPSASQPSASKPKKKSSRKRTEPKLREYSFKQKTEENALVNSHAMQHFQLQNHERMYNQEAPRFPAEIISHYPYVGKNTMLPSFSIPATHLKQPQPFPEVLPVHQFPHQIVTLPQYIMPVTHSMHTGINNSSKFISNLANLTQNIAK